MQYGQYTLVLSTVQLNNTIKCFPFQVNDFHCACRAGFTGRTCATDIDDCESNPCVNEGECVDQVSGFRCICPVGFAGQMCEVSPKASTYRGFYHESRFFSYGASERKSNRFKIQNCMISYFLRFKAVLNS